MPRAKPKTDMFDPTPLGTHKGLPVLEQKLIITKTGDGLSDSVGVAPSEIDIGGERNISGRISHRKQRFDNVYSKDDGKLIGVTQVDIFAAEAVVFDNRPETDDLIDDMVGRIADKREKEAQEKKGQFRLPDAEGNEVATVSEIRPGVPDDEGASATDE